MNYLNNSNHTYVYESLESYNLLSKDVLIHKSNLSKEDSIKYFLNKNELEMYRDLSEELKINYNNFSEYISNISNTKYNRFPFQISLIGDKKLEKYKYEIQKNFSLFRLSK
ncbi:hypothetical protein ETH99_08410 [Macrococcoides caseolyticum]|uniref:hypothetical protein n=1 Tax=Macrococcoides caseolyticum TaxID=69966 RepID=UPI00105C472A|nr:hypothetical protein [Macrococcus caseolyticus]TDM26023.1 hypothetical protein ETH99_08410 [Macrococcus caseolyticus]